MHMPGFTAGSSLYKTGGHSHERINTAGYQALRTSEPTAGAVVPQRCYKDYDEVCNVECESQCERPEQPPPKPEQPKRNCRTICCVDGRLQLT